MYNSTFNALQMARARMKRRHEIEDEFHIDFTQPLDQLEYSILHRLSSTDLSMVQTLQTLRQFAQYCQHRFDGKKQQQIDSTIRFQPVNLTDFEILACLKGSLFRDSSEIRAQTLRCMRFYIRSKECVHALLQLNIHHLVARSLDLMVKNEFERIQALRLMRHIMAFDTQIIPIVFGRCLCAIVSDNLAEKDALLRPCMATIAEMTLVNPNISHRTGCIRAMVKNAVNVVLCNNLAPNMINDNGRRVGGGNNQHKDYPICVKMPNTELPTSNSVLLEAILTSFLHLFNLPETRQFLLANGEDFNEFIAPFTDTYSFLQASLAAEKALRERNPVVDNNNGGNVIQQAGGVPNNRPGPMNSGFQSTLEERLFRYSACKQSLLSILRSWPGLFFMCRIVQDKQANEICNGSHRHRANSHTSSIPISEAYYCEIYNQTNLLHLRSLQDSLKFFGIEGGLMPRKVTQLVSGVGKAINSSRQTSPFFSVTSYESMTPIESLIGILHLPYPEVHQHILELLFDLFGLRLPKSAQHFEDCLLYVYFALLNKSAKHCGPQWKEYYPNEWQIYDGFVVREGEHILQAKATNRLNYLVAYHALLLQLMVEYGVIEALVSVVLDSDDIGCVHLATILIGELIYLSGKYLPASTYAHRCQSLPSLVAASVSNHKSRRSRALTAISNLHQIHELKKKTSQPASLFLEQQIFFCKASNCAKNGAMRSHSASFNKSQDELVVSLIKSCGILKKNNFKDWNWWTIADVLRHPGEALKKLEEKDTHRAFVRRLLDFYKPSNRRFSNIVKTEGSTSHNNDTLLYSNRDRKLPIYVDNPRQLCIVATLFIDFLLSCEDNKINELIEELLLDLDGCFMAVSKAMPDRDDSVFVTSHMTSTLSHHYFLLIGRLTHTPAGRSWLDRTQMHQCLIDMINLNQRTSKIHLKLLVSSLDYSDAKFSRTILNKTLTCTSDTIRLYATEFMRILLRAQVASFDDWAVEMLLAQLYDANPLVAYAALDILDEACAADANCLLKVISHRPSILHLGDLGIVFMARFASLPAGLIYLRQTSMLGNELNRWRDTFAARHVRLAEDALNEIFSLHQRNESGTYGRRSDRDRTSFWPNLRRFSTVLYAMPHLYGQLAQTPKGVEIIKKEAILDELICRIEKGVKCLCGQHSARLNDADILKLKAALWSIGHVMTSEDGVRLVLDTKTQLLAWIVKLARSSLVISLRFTCYLVLCLVSSTKRGSIALKRHGWVSIDHGAEDTFPINQQEYDNFYFDGRPRFMSDPNQTKLPHDYLVSGENSSEDDCGSHKKESPISSLNSVNSLDSNTSSLGCLELVPSNTNRNRPRSSSDTVGNNKPAQASKVQLMSNLSGVEDNRNRKISAPCVTLTSDVTRDGRSDSNESGTTNNTAFYSSGIDSRTTSLADFSVSSCASNATTEIGNTLVLNQARELARQDRKDDRQRERSRKTKKLSSPSEHGQSSSLFLTDDPYPSPTDAHGYAQLRAIQKQRVQSLSGNMFSGVTKPMDILATGSKSPTKISRDNLLEVIVMPEMVVPSGRQRKISTNLVPPMLSFDSNGSGFNGSLDSVDSELAFPRRLFQRTGSHISRRSNESSVPMIDDYTLDNNIGKGDASAAPSVLCLALPETLPNLFDLAEENSNAQDETIQLGGDKLERKANNDGSEQHRKWKCLLCCCASNQSDQAHESNETKHSTTTNNNGELSMQQRKEVIRLVISLSASMTAKSTEQGLLNLKQKCASLFEDICLYSDVCSILESCHYRASARRFLHELFVDISPDALQKRAQLLIIRKKPEVIVVEQTESQS